MKLSVEDIQTIRFSDIPDESKRPLINKLELIDNLSVEELVKVLESSTDDIQKASYDEGHAVGFDEGHDDIGDEVEDSFNEGHDKGYDEGFDDGYDKAVKKYGKKKLS